MSKLPAPAPAPSPVPAPAVDPVDPPVQKGVSSWSVAWRQFKRDKVALTAVGFLVVMGLVSLGSPLIANDKPVWVSYKGRWYFPAFKDYLDENIPIPLGIPAWLRRFSFFSPAYQGQIDRPLGMQFPDWQEIKAAIDGPEGRERGDWYLSAPVPFYYKQTSRGIKLLPGRSLGRLDVIEPAPEPGDDPRRLVYSPNERWEDVWQESRLTPETPWARVVWSERDDGWVLDDGSRIDAQIPGGWIPAPGHRGGDLLVRHYEHPGGKGQLELFEDLRRPPAPLGVDEPDPTRLSEQLLARYDDVYPFLADVAPDAGKWITVAGKPTYALTIETSESGLRQLHVWLVRCDDRVLGAVLRTAPDDPVVERLAGSLRVVPATGATVNGKPVAGAPRRLRPDDEVVLPGPTPVKLRFKRLPRHHVGTDDVGRDVLSRLIHGTVIAGSVGIVSVSIYVTIGVILGALAGYFRGWMDLLLSRLIEVVICFPTFFLIITIVALWEEPSIYNIMIALGLVSWTGVARLVRGEFLKIMSEDYVQAARALGFSDARIIFRHVLPNGVAPVFVSASFGVAGAILVESSLSFLGFGVAPPTASWGEILQQGRRYINENLYHLVWAPGFCIFITVTMFNLVGEGLRDALDPKLRQ